MDENERLGKSGMYAEAGDIVTVVKGYKYPIGLTMVVNGTIVENYRVHHRFRGFRANNEYVEGDVKYLLFVDEGDNCKIDARNTEIVATPHNQFIYYNNVRKGTTSFDRTEVGSF